MNQERENSRILKWAHFPISFGFLDKASIEIEGGHTVPNRTLANFSRRIFTAFNVVVRVCLALIADRTGHRFQGH